MITIQNLRELMESTESAALVEDMLIYESMISTLENPTFSDAVSMDESASEEKKAILNGEDMRQAKQLIKDANKLKKSDPEASKKKCDQAIAKLKKLQKDAEKISDDNTAIELCKMMAAFIPSLIYCMLYCSGITAAPVMAYGAISLIPAIILNKNLAQSRIGHNKIYSSGANNIIDPLKFNEMSKTQAIGAIETMIKKAEGIKTNKTFIDKLKDMMGIPENDK